MIQHTREWFHSNRGRFIHKKNTGCAKCGQMDGDIELHHIVPLAIGGTNHDSNIVPLCRECHELVHEMQGFRLLGKKAKERKRKEDPNYKEGRPRKFDSDLVNEALDWIELGNSYQKSAEKFGISKTTLIRRMQERKGQCANREIQGV